MPLSKIEFPRQLFVTGTDTDVGKTVICSLLTIGLKGTYWKPIQSGIPTDTEWIKQVTQLPDKHFLPEIYRLIQHLSPHLASKIDGVKIDIEKIFLPNIDSHLILEGAGGLMVPINNEFFVIDLIKKLQLPVLLVTRSTLGTINHTLLSLEQLRKYQIPIFGVIMNGPKNSHNRDAIENYGKIKVLAEVENLNPISPTTLLKEFQRNFQI